MRSLPNYHPELFRQNLACAKPGPSAADPREDRGRAWPQSESMGKRLLLPSQLPLHGRPKLLLRWAGPDHPRSLPPSGQPRRHTPPDPGLLQPGLSLHPARTQPARGTQTTRARRNPPDLQQPAGRGQRVAKDAEAGYPGRSRPAGAARFTRRRATSSDCLPSPSCPRLASGCAARCSHPLGLRCVSVWWRGRRARRRCASQLATPSQACGAAAAPMRRTTPPRQPGCAGERRRAARVRAAGTAASASAQATRTTRRAAVQLAVGRHLSRHYPQQRGTRCGCSSGGATPCVRSCCHLRGLAHMAHAPSTCWCASWSRAAAWYPHAHSRAPHAHSAAWGA